VIPLQDNIPTRTFPVMTVGLIALNVLVYLFQITHDRQATYAYTMVPALVTHAPTAVIRETGLPVWTTIFTAMFLHGGFSHIAGNMLYLWIFGNNTEDTLGRARFILFYLTCGAAAAALQIAMDPNSRIPTLGASGAIAGVLGAYIHLYPRARIKTAVLLIFVFTIIELPAIVVLGFWFVLQLYNMLGSAAATLGGAPSSGGVAFGAHVGGFLCGWLLTRLFQNRPPSEDRYYPRPRFFDEG
jgi:membrane associated rhomboid family serine protease